MAEQIERPTHAVQLIFICSRTPDSEQADWKPDIDSIAEKLGARHIYARPVELPPAFRGLWDPGAKPPTEWPPPKPNGGGHKAGELAQRSKKDGHYATKGGMIALYPRDFTSIDDTYEAVYPPAGSPTIDWRAEPITGRLIPLEEIDEGDLRFLVEWAEEALDQAPADLTVRDRERLLKIKQLVAGAG